MGMELTVQGTAGSGYVADLVPEVAQTLAWGSLVSKEAVQDEIDIMLRAIRGFWELEPDQVMQMCSALSARCTELEVHLHRLEGQRQWRQVRTMEVARVLAELDRQFKLASRMLEVRRQDLESTR